MRLNAYIASASDLSRRTADTAIANGRVRVNGEVASLGTQVGDSDKVTLDGQPLQQRATTTTVVLNKPTGFVCSRAGQGSQTIYDLLPPELHHLQPVGRLDKDSSGLLLLTDDGQLSHQLTHPSFEKTKVYEVELDKDLSAEDQQQITEGVELEDGLSKLQLEQPGGKAWRITMHEGRNRQIRRTFEKLDYRVTNLHRTRFGDHQLGNIAAGSYEKVSS